MRELIERIKQRIMEESDIPTMYVPFLRVISVKECKALIDEESAKEPQECEIARYMESCEDCGFCELRESSVNRAETQSGCISRKEKGSLIELPCNVGDSVYFIKSYFSYCKEPIEEKVDRIIITNIVTFKTENRTFCLNDIGTKVFLTQAEAEQALAERKG